MTSQVTARDRSVWEKCRTLRDVADVTALWLEGHVASQPCCEPNCGPDEETQQLIPTLACANRAGFLTTCSQPGHDEVCGYDGALWLQRPAIQGFIHPGPLLNELAYQADLQGLLVLANHHKQSWLLRSRRVAVTIRKKQAVTWVGAPRFNPYAHDLLCPRSAASDIEQAVQLTIIDKRYAAVSDLWEVVHRVCTTSLRPL